MSSISDKEVNVELSFHGAAANSCPHSLLWVRAPINNNNNNSGTNSDKEVALEETVIYASSGVINLATCSRLLLTNNTNNNNTNNTNTNNNDGVASSTVTQTLVTRTLDHANNSSTKRVLARGEAVEDAAASRSVTALAYVDASASAASSSSGGTNNDVGIVAAFSDGTVTSWRYCCSAAAGGSISSSNKKWMEHVLIGHDPLATTNDGAVGSHRVFGRDDIGSTTNDGSDGNDGTATIAAAATGGGGAANAGGDANNVNNLEESIADVTAISLTTCHTTTDDVVVDNDSTWLVATASSKGVFLHVQNIIAAASSASSSSSVYTRRVNGNAASSVQLVGNTHNFNSSNSNSDSNVEIQECFLFSGSASPRHNKVWVSTISYHNNTTATSTATTTASTNNNASAMNNTTNDATTTTAAWAILPLLTIQEPIHHGYLLGHQDWITCFAWLPLINNNAAGNTNEGNESLLASSGHDAKIRLWKFTTTTTNNNNNNNNNTTNGNNSSSNNKLLENDDDDDDDNDNSANNEDSDEDEAAIDDLEEEEGEARLTIHHAATTATGGACTTTAISLEALLLGHEEPVTSLTWRTKSNTTKTTTTAAAIKTTTATASREKPCLLSSSMDRTILLWMEEDGVWVPISRVGSAGGILGGSIGSSLMGFVDARFSPECANRIVGHGYGGSIHFWTQVEEEEEEEVQHHPSDDIGVHMMEGVEEEGVDGAEVSTEEQQPHDGEEEDALVSARWVADPNITGHFRSVEDLAWDPEGEYLLTTGSDQTTRLWSEVPAIVASNSTQHHEKQQTRRWMEVGRPQVHGYDMTSIACIGGHSTICDDPSITEEGEPRHRFVSGADEKVLRVFDAPASTLRLLRSLKKLKDPSQSGNDDAEPGNNTASWRVERAFLPSLGLSNKATVETDERESDKFAGPTSNDDEFGDAMGSSGVVDSSIDELTLPLERDLGASTLWPETRKLFGHESELVCLDAYRSSSRGSDVSLVASSCKARNDVASASIRLWNVKLGKCVGILKGGHRSTVSTLSFSSDGKYLASSGKDRRICIWKRLNNDQSGDQEGGSGNYQLTAAVDSAHKRIVWSVHFCPAKTNILASGSRDGFVKLWRIVEAVDGSLEMKELLRFEPVSKAGKKSDPVTAVSFADGLLPCSESCVDYGILSIGTESGRIEVWALPISDNKSSSQSTNGPHLLYAVPANDCHFDSVKKIAWRPINSEGNVSSPSSLDLTLASCGRDCGVRIFNLRIGNCN